MLKKLPLIMILILFLAFVSSKVLLYQPSGTPLKVWEHRNGNQQTTVTLPFYQALTASGLHQFFYETGSLDGDYLVIPQLYGYAYKLYLNGAYLHGTGDFENPTANVWTYAQAFDLSSQPTRPINRIQLDVYGLHDIGFNAIPFLTDKNTAIRRVTAINILNHDLTNLFIGFTLGFALLFFFFTFRMDQNKLVYLYYAIALSLFAFYSLEFTFRATSGTIEAYLWLRKLLLMSIYCAGYFLLMAQRLYFLNRKTPPLLALLYNLPLVFMVIAQDFIAISKVQTALNLITLSTILYIAFIGLFHRYKATLIPNTILVLTVLHTIANQFFGLMHPYMLHLGVMVFLFGLCTIIVLDFQLIENENRKLGQISKTDSLTQAFNRSVLNSLICTPEDCFVFIDLDRFKAYNDTFGHQKGDQLLKDIVGIFNHNIRKSDYVIRYGGDEFILYFKSCPVEVVEATIKRIQESIEELGSVGISFGICPYQDTVISTILKADRDMYTMKNRNRNT